MTSASIKVRTRKKSQEDPALLSLLVESSTEHTLEDFTPEMITASLISELSFTEEQAKDVTEKVVAKLVSFCEHTNSKNITTSLIRSIVNVVLLERGNKKELKSMHDIVISKADITNIIENANTENGNLTHSPESINFTLAERILKDYALNEIFTADVARAHRQNKIYVHDLGSSQRAYCSGHSPLYILRHGIKNVPNILSTSAPANSAWTLARHICSMTQFYSGIFAGAIGWEGINIFFAPLVVGFSQKKLKQLAQTLIFDLSQLAGAKGGQTSFTDFNVYLTIPNHYRECLVLGKGGKYVGVDISGNEKYYQEREDLIRDEKAGIITGLRYKNFEKEVQNFAKAIFSVIEEGDASGLPFAFPKINMHINEDVFTSLVFVPGKGFSCNHEGKTIFFKDLETLNTTIKEDPTIIVDRVPNVAGERLLMAACKAASKSGCPYFIFDRGGASVSQCCRLKIDMTEEDLTLLKEHPEDLRFVGVQNVSIILPNAALDCKGSEAKMLEDIERRMRLAVKAHISRTEYLKKLMKLPNSPLRFYNFGMDGKPYVNFDRGSYLIGMIGLNECVYNLIGKEMHESQDAYLKGLEIIAFMAKKCKELTKEFNMSIKLEETPGEGLTLKASTSDVRKYGAKAFVKHNDIGSYYTNSVHFDYACNMDYLERLVKQSAFHTYIEAGAMVHLWIGEKSPNEVSLFNLAKYVQYHTQCVQFTISGEFTRCNSCIKTHKGFFEACPICGSHDVTQVARVTGYYSVVGHFNKGKKAEFKDRNRGAYNII